MNGFINVLKPVGATASDVVVCVRRILGVKKVGHLGTLDPGASGVLPIAVGQATKLFNLMTDKVKLYRAFFTFGKTTDTLDSYGEVTGVCGKLPLKEEILAAASALTGECAQLPPIYSAISVNGVRSYKRARSGEEVTLSPRKVKIYSIVFLRKTADDTYCFDIECSAGTYIRSIVRDIAQAVGSLGYMSGLIRLKSGIFDISGALTLDEIREKGFLAVSDVMCGLIDLENCDIDEKFYYELLYGRKIACPFESSYRKIYCRGEFFGVGKNIDGTLCLEYFLRKL